MSAKTVAERVSDLRSRRKADGLVKLELWVHKFDVTRMKKHAGALAARRARLLEAGIIEPSLEDQEARLIAIAKSLPRRKRPPPSTA